MTIGLFANTETEPVLPRENSAMGERQLWAAVIERAIQDVVFETRQKFAKEHAQSARRYLRSDLLELHCEHAFPNLPAAADIIRAYVQAQADIAWKPDPNADVVNEDCEWGIE